MRRLLIILFLHSVLSGIYAQEDLIEPGVSRDQLIIDDKGIMRWRRDSSEVTGFGINYTVPFAYAYRAGKKLNIDLKAAIDQDVYHFARLGLDLFRVHIWDCEISDTLGNLLDNEHLDLFDYLLFRLQQRGINAVVTPIAYWGNGWPEPDEPTPGFSTKYGKENCLTDNNAIRAQENYLRQFISHVNRYTGIAYKFDPMILAFEISNEPHHKGIPEDVTSFVSKMTEAIRSTGCTKPVFYNVSHSIHFAEAYFDGGIDGGTFQWYPTGLGFQKELGGNMLPNVDRYTIPFENILKENKAARFVYEFDAADMASNYMYPAMARSFRTAGMQLATHFSYDPTFLAPFNTEYNTHFMNLPYAPRKALSLMICAEIFRKIPLYSAYGFYPDNTSFGPFRVSYEEDLAEMVTDEKFIYTNHTKTKPASISSLRMIAGWGNSPLVEYDGTGAYFLDKVGDGIWRLELMPDAMITDNLFGQNNLSSIRAIVKHERRKIKFNLPEFQNGFAIESVDWRDSIIYRESLNHPVDLVPGIYLLTSPDYEESDAVTLDSLQHIGMEDYAAPISVEGIHRPYSSADKRRSHRASSTSGGGISLFNASEDYAWVNRQWVRGTTLISTDTSAHLYVKLTGLVRKDNENPNAAPIPDYSMRHYFGDIIEPYKKELNSKTSLVMKGYAVGDSSFPIQLALVMKDGSAFGGIVELIPGKKEYMLSVQDLKRVKTVLLPRPYPTFLPYYSAAGSADKLDITQIESLQISIGPEIEQGDWNDTYELMLESVMLK